MGHDRLRHEPAVRHDAGITNPSYRFPRQYIWDIRLDYLIAGRGV
jgi:hypothetical protein